MNQKKITIIISIIALLIAIVALFVVWQNKQPTIAELPRSAVEYVPTSTTTATQSFSFGELVNTYEDEEFNFSLRYPDEIGIASVQKSCRMDLYMKDSTRGYPPFMSMYSPACPSPLVNSSATSLDDYRNNYVQDNGVIVSILNTDDILTVFGSRVIKQEYQTFSGSEKMENSNRSAFSTRYVFHNPQKGFYIIQMGGVFSDAYSSDFDTTVSYKEVEIKIIDSVQY